MGTKSGSRNRNKAAVVPGSMMAVASAVPTAPHVKAELLAFWDGFSPLSLGALTMLCDNGRSLDDAGVGEDDAASFVNKYNSIVLRAPGKGPLVRASDARAWHTDPMQSIIDTVTARATP
ncbi:MAG TPA: hypothetical protein VIP05_32200 [Burkholderiaceae bacterium]